MNSFEILNPNNIRIFTPSSDNDWKLYQNLVSIVNLGLNKPFLDFFSYPVKIYKVFSRRSNDPRDQRFIVFYLLRSDMKEWYIMLDISCLIYSSENLKLMMVDLYLVKNTELRSEVIPYFKKDTDIFGEANFASSLFVENNEQATESEDDAHDYKEMLFLSASCNTEIDRFIKNEFLAFYEKFEEKCNMEEDEEEDD